MMKLIKAFIIGIGIGQIFYIGSIALAGVETQTVSNMLSVALLSGLMGVASLIYDNKKLSLLVTTVFHYVMILALASVMNIYNNWLPLTYFFTFMFEFTAIYIVIWGIIYYLERRKIKQINRYLEKRKSSSVN